MVKYRVTIKHKSIDQIVSEVDQAAHQDLDLFGKIKLHQDVVNKSYKKFEKDFFIFVNFVVRFGGTIDIGKDNDCLEYSIFPHQITIKIPEDLLNKIKNHSLVEKVEVI